MTVGGYKISQGHPDAKQCVLGSSLKDGFTWNKACKCHCGMADSYR
ncbi:hypothetical protein [Anaplasma platys]|nr:hypothetical protein [Anaplasma platys]